MADDDRGRWRQGLVLSHANPVPLRQSYTTATTSQRALGSNRRGGAHGGNGGPPLLVPALSSLAASAMLGEHDASKGDTYLSVLTAVNGRDKAAM